MFYSVLNNTSKCPQCGCVLVLETVSETLTTTVIYKKCYNCNYKAQMEVN